jgi:two-component system sensor histidine kinase HydH
MAGSLVHEIKNPLSTMNINAQLLLEDWKDGATPKEQRTVKRLKVMISEVDRLERIMQSFLRFTEHHTLKLEVTSLNDCLEDLVEFIQPEAQKRKVEVRYWLDPALDPFPFDPDLVRQVFHNLILNALHAMEEKGGELILRTRSVERNGISWAVGDVIDTGCGIAPHIRDKVFDLYFSSRMDGNGLGLSTSKRITEEHGGFIEIDTEVGKGSQFSVFLPRRHEEAPSASDAGDAGDAPLGGEEIEGRSVNPA